MRKFQAVAATLLLAGGCTGSIVDGSATGSGETPPPGATGPAGPTGPVADPGVVGFEPGPATLRRLTRAQYANAIRDLLGPDITVRGDFEPDTVLSGFASIGAVAHHRVGHGGREVRERGQRRIATQALADAGRRARLVTCTPAAPPTRPARASS